MSRDKDESRRNFLKWMTLAMGGVIGVVTAIPLVRYFVHPVGRKIVDSPDAPVDAIGYDDLVAGGPPVRVQLRVSGVRNAWNVADDVPLGSAWVQKDASGEVRAFSSTCPHLGCAIAYSDRTGKFLCPCHNSEFETSGAKVSGPSKRDLDPLPTERDGDRVKITYKRFRGDVADRHEV
jgi:Rieske Fe-S protein